MRVGRGVAESLAHTERELLEERAAALVRIAARLEALLAEHERLRGALDTLSGETRRARIVACHELRREVALYRWYLTVQREALGLFHHADLERFYPLPDEVA